mmetsp:Transcript_21129/g.61682  ORF Transcript_21129/g.61682 Transcript_21129/m.61682 type:complete len:240 (+) Transcript_21129:328-1047(+)
MGLEDFPEHPILDLQRFLVPGLPSNSFKQVLHFSWELKQRVGLQGLFFVAISEWGVSRATDLLGESWEGSLRQTVDGSRQIGKLLNERNHGSGRHSSAIHVAANPVIVVDLFLNLCRCVAEVGDSQGLLGTEPLDNGLVLNGRFALHSLACNPDFIDTAPRVLEHVRQFLPLRCQAHGKLLLKLCQPVAVGVFQGHDGVASRLGSVGALGGKWHANGLIEPRVSRCRIVVEASMRWKRE